MQISQNLILGRIFSPYLVMGVSNPGWVGSVWKGLMGAIRILPCQRISPGGGGCFSVDRSPANPRPVSLTTIIRAAERQRLAKTVFGGRIFRKGVWRGISLSAIALYGLVGLGQLTGRRGSLCCEKASGRGPPTTQPECTISSSL